MDIGLDLDGVVYNFTCAFQTHVAKCKPELAEVIGDVTMEADTWDWFERWPMTRDEFLEEMTCAVNRGELFWTMKLYEPDIQWQIHRLRCAGHNIHIVTHRFSGSTPKVSEAATRTRLFVDNIRYSTLTFAKDKTSVPTDVFIEDNIDNYDALVKAGVNAFLMNRPYNFIPNDDRNRVDTFREFTEKVLSLS